MSQNLTENFTFLSQTLFYQLETDEPVADCKNLTPGVEGQKIGTISEDDHRNSGKQGGGGFIWTLFFLAVLVCGVVGFVVFQKKQEAKKHRFY